MTNIDRLEKAAQKAINELANAVTRSDYGMPNYGRTWGPWTLWDGSSEFGPHDLEERLVNVYRASPLSELYLVAEAHHIDWLKTGSGDDVLAYRVEIDISDDKDAE